MSKRRKHRNPSGGKGLMTALVIGGIVYLAYRKWRGLGNGDYAVITKPKPTPIKPPVTTPVKAQPAGPSWWQQTVARTYMPVQPYSQAGTQTPAQATAAPATLPTLTKPTVVKPEYGIYEPGQFDITGQPAVTNLPATPYGRILTTVPGTLEPIVRPPKKAETLSELKDRPYAEILGGPFDDPFTFSYNARRAVLTDIAERLPSGVDRDMKLSLASKWADMADSASSSEVRMMPENQKIQYLSKLAEGTFEPMDQFQTSDIMPPKVDPKYASLRYDPLKVEPYYDQYNSGGVKSRENELRMKAYELGGSGWFPKAPTGVSWPKEELSDEVIRGASEGVERIKKQADVLSGKANKGKVLMQAAGKTKDDVKREIQGIESGVHISGQEWQARAMLTGQSYGSQSGDFAGRTSEEARSFYTTDPEKRRRAQNDLDESLQYKQNRLMQLQSWLPDFR